MCMLGTTKQASQEQAFADEGLSKEGEAPVPDKS